MYKFHLKFLGGLHFKDALKIISNDNDTKLIDFDIEDLYIQFETGDIAVLEMIFDTNKPPKIMK